MTEPVPDENDGALWDEACRRAVAIRQFLKRNSGQSTVAAVADLASGLDLSQASAYRLLKKFHAEGTVAPKSLRHILQITDGITANIFQMLDTRAIDAIENGSAFMTDSAVETWVPMRGTGAAFA